MCIYTDDTIDGSLDKKKVERAKKELEKHYDVKNMKEVNYILEIKMERMKDEIQISQQAYVYYMLKKFSIVSCKLRLISLVRNTKIGFYFIFIFCFFSVYAIFRTRIRGQWDVTGHGHTIT